MPIQVPESYRAYCKDRAVQEAVNHILDAKSLHVPADIEWDDLPKFHRAVLAANQVRCEYAIFLHELWNAVWKPVLDTCDIAKELKPWTDDRYTKMAQLEFDAHTLWSEGRLGQPLDVADTKLVLLPEVDVGYEGLDYERARLCLSLLDNGDPIVGLDLGADWRSEDAEDGVPRSRRELAPIADDGSIDLEALGKAAADALAAIGARLQDYR